MLFLLFLTWKFSLKAKIHCYLYMYVQHMLSYLFTWYDPMFYDFNPGCLTLNDIK